MQILDASIRAACCIAEAWLEDSDDTDNFKDQLEDALTDEGSIKLLGFACRNLPEQVCKQMRTKYPNLDFLFPITESDEDASAEDATAEEQTKKGKKPQHIPNALYTHFQRIVKNKL